MFSSRVMMPYNIGTETGHHFSTKHVQSILLQSKQVSCSLFASHLHPPAHTNAISRTSGVIHRAPCYGVSVCASSRPPPHWSIRALSSDGGTSKDNMISDEKTLQQELDKAIAEENYSLAAKLRDALRLLHEDNKAAILAANDLFYNAFRKGDVARMHTIWVKGDHIQCVHPGAGRICGYDLVMESWELVANVDVEFPLKIELQNTEVYVRGDVGYVTCLEVVKTKGSSWGRQVATNVFEKVDGQWLLCIHHASHVGV